MLGFVLVNFVNGDSGVYDGRLDSFLLDDWLDGLHEMSACVTRIMSGDVHIPHGHDDGRARPQ